MDLSRLIHQIGDILKEGNWHLPLFVGYLGAMKNHGSVVEEKAVDLGNVPGDNILPKEILVSFNNRS